MSTLLAMLLVVLCPAQELDTGLPPSPELGPAQAPAVQPPQVPDPTPAPPAPPPQALPEAPAPPAPAPGRGELSQLVLGGPSGSDAAKPLFTLALEQDSTAQAPTPAPPERAAAPVSSLLPPPPQGGLLASLFWLALVALAVTLSGGAERLAARLTADSAAARLLSTLGGLGRVMGVLFALMAGLLLLPAPWAPAVPYVLVGAALALGWTLRDLLRDLLAGVVMMVEGRIRQGLRVRVSNREGHVRQLGLRSTLLEDDAGLLLTVPNHLFLDEAVAVDVDPYAPVEVAVHVPPGAGAGHVRQILEELALLSPYMAPSRPPHVYRDPDKQNLWIVEVRLVHPRYARTFRGALVEMADEVLRQPGATPVKPEPEGRD